MADASAWSSIGPLLGAAALVGAGAAIRAGAHLAGGAAHIPHWKTTLWCNIVGSAGVGWAAAAHGESSSLVFALAGGFTTFSGACLDAAGGTGAAHPAAGASRCGAIARGAALLAATVGGGALACGAAGSGAPGWWLVAGTIALIGALWAVPGAKAVPREGQSRDLDAPRAHPSRRLAAALFGGALGGLARLAIEPGAAAAGWAVEPAAAIMIANLTGAAAVGVVAARVRSDVADAFWRTGFCGGLTTVSALSLILIQEWSAGGSARPVLLASLHVCAGPLLTMAAIRAMPRRGARSSRG